MSAHTSEPLRIDYSKDEDLRRGHVYISAEGHAGLAQVVWKMEDDERSPTCEATAHRLVDCYNACKGINPEAVPMLLAALRVAVRQNSHDMLMTGDELRVCEAAIAKATQP